MKRFLTNCIGILVLSLCLFAGRAHAQAPGLYINEVSQGPSGAKEWVELVVVGTPTCYSIPTLDLRGWYIDDNNGFHATGTGTGIATGCVRFTTNALWSAVPIGTLILIYNDADRDAALPSTDDLSLTDGNCRLVIPISNCTLFEKNTAQPSTALATYPTTGFSTCGSWTNISMANSDDSYQTINPAGTLFHSVSWGNNTISPIIYFAGSATGNVAYMTNASNNNISLQANWVMVPVATETPGVPNNPANNTWICKMNNGCTPPTPISLNTTFVNASCTCTGSANVVATGGYTGCGGSYTYNWSPTGGNAASATGLCAGTYTVTVTDVNGCNSSQSVTLTAASSLTLTATQTNVLCNGGNTGSATVTATGGTGPYTYAWAPSGGNAATATGLSAGAYTVTVTDALLCVGTLTVTITQPNALASIPTNSSVSCNGGSNASAAVFATGGTGPYSYAWTPSGGNAATALALSAGSYSCTITDAHGCTTVQAFVITQPTAITSTQTHTNVLCNGGSNATASVSPTGGTGTYTYAWAPSGGNASSATGLSAGSYTCTITDANGCTNLQTVVITQPTALSATTTQTNVTCYNNANGSAILVPAGGTGPYTYAWAPSGGNAATATGLSVGTYSCTITDANGCTFLQTVTITQPTILSATSTSVAAICSAANGSATATPSGGTGPYTYSWLPSGGTNATATNLIAGNYTCTITDANNCTTTTSVVVNSSGGITASVTASTSISCFGGNNGSVTVAPSGGTGPYVYAWSPSGGSAATATGLTAGSYTCTITDANNCSTTQSITITQPTALTTTASTTPVDCFGNATGSASVVASGGTAGYTYLWSPSGGSNATATTLLAQTYSCIVTDANGCTSTQTVAITEPPALTLITSGANISCNNACDGQLVSNVSGGTPGYSFAWSSGCSTASCAQVCAGTYTLVITDANGCTRLDSVSLTEPPAIVLTTSTVDAFCNQANGSATASASGGGGNFNYQWVNGPANATYANISAGNYSVIATDQNGCSDTALVTVANLNGVTASASSVTNLTCYNSNDGSIQLQASGGTGPYSYNWLPNVSSSDSALNIAAGNYQIAVTDANGCISTVSVTVTQPQQIIVSITTPDSVLCNGQNTTLTATASGGTPTYTFVWNPGLLIGNVQTVQPASTTTYVAYASDQNGCIDSTSLTVSVESSPSAAFTADTLSGCAPVCVNFTDLSTIFGPSALVSWLWDFGDGNTSNSQNPSHCYTVSGNNNVTLTVVSAAGCSSSITQNNFIQVNPNPVAAFAFTPQHPTLVNPLVTFTDLSTGATTWNWSMGDLLNSSSTQQNPTFLYPDATCYQVQLVVTNAFGCMDDTTQEVCIEPEVTLYVPNTFTPNGDGINDYFSPQGLGLDWNTYHLTIFDRWGNLIFETYDIHQPWDGRVQTHPTVVQEDVYVWKLDVRDVKGRDHNLVGHVNVLK